MTYPSRDIPYRLFYDQHGRSKTVNDILEFGRLPIGWHYGKGGPVQLHVLKLAREIYSAALANGFNETEASPGQNGEVMLSVFNKNHCLDFVVDPDGSINFYYEVDDEVLDKAKNLTLADAKAKLIWFGAQQWNVYGLFTEGTTAPKKGVSTDWHLKTIRA